MTNDDSPKNILAALNSVEDEMIALAGNDWPRLADRYGQLKTALADGESKWRAFVEIREMFAPYEGARESLDKALLEQNLPEIIPPEYSTRSSPSEAITSVNMAANGAKDQHAQLLQMLADCNKTLAHVNMALDEANALYARACIYCDLAAAAGENRRVRLWQALADSSQVLFVVSIADYTDKPASVKLSHRANMLYQRAYVHHELSRIWEENQEAWLLLALADYNEAYALWEGEPLAEAKTLAGRAAVYRDLATLEGEDRRAWSLRALADYDEAVILEIDMTFKKAQLLNNRALIYHDLSTMKGEDKHRRLLQALADDNEALTQADDRLLRVDILNNRADIYSHLSTLQGEDKRGRLLQALADCDEAVDLVAHEPLDKAYCLTTRAEVHDALEMEQGEDQQARLLQALGDCNEALSLLPSNAPTARARILTIRGPVSYKLATVQVEGRRTWLQQAFADFDELISTLTPPPDVKAQLLTGRADVFGDLATVVGEDRLTRLLQALADYDEALILQTSDDPPGKATILNNRATVLRDLAMMPGEDRRARLLQGLADHNEALSIRAKRPLDKALTLNNRATVYLALSTVQGEDKRTRLLQALADCDEALPIRAERPLDKAFTLTNRANIYCNMATIEAEDRRTWLFRALTDCSDALVLRDKVPLDRAGTLINRGGILGDIATLPGEDRRTRLLQALRDATEGLGIVGLLGHSYRISIARNVLLKISKFITILLGVETLGVLWHEVTAEPCPYEGLEALDEPPQYPPEARERLSRLSGLLVEWVQTPSLDASQQYLKEHQEELLDIDAMHMMRTLVKANPGKPEMASHQDVLYLCQEIGIKVVYDELIARGEIELVGKEVAQTNISRLPTADERLTELAETNATSFMHESRCEMVEQIRHTYISYAFEDVAIAEMLAAALETFNIPVLFCRPPSSDSGSDTIVKAATDAFAALRSAQLIIFVLTEHAQTSEQVRDEMDRALKYQQNVIGMVVSGQNKELYLGSLNPAAITDIRRLDLGPGTKSVAVMVRELLLSGYPNWNGGSILPNKVPPDESDDWVTALLNMGVECQNRSQLNGSLRIFQEALMLLQQSKDKARKGAVWAMIAHVHRLQNNKEEALNYYRQALKIFRETQDKEAGAMTFACIGELHDECGDKKKASFCYSEAKRLSEEVTKEKQINK